MDKLILNSQKKLIHELIISVGLEPANFYWHIERSTKEINTEISCLRYKDSESYFKFDFKNNQHYCVYVPGGDRAVETRFPGDWDHERDCLIGWLNNLRREIETIDPWDEIEKYIPGEKIDLEDERTNAPFSILQVGHIVGSLNKLKEEINRHYQLDEEQIIIVQNKLDYLTDRAKSIGRIDWKNIFVSTIIGLAFQLAMDTEQTKLLWNLVKTCFRGVLLLGGK